MKMNIPLMATLLGLSLIVCPILYIYVGPALDATQLSTPQDPGHHLRMQRRLVLHPGRTYREQFPDGQALEPAAHRLYLDYRRQRRHAAPFGRDCHSGHPLGLPSHHEFRPQRAYKLKFWEGEEDYRWAVVRNGAPFKGNRLAWGVFDLFFICIYQNALVLMTTFPALVSMNSTVPFGWVDAVAAALMFGFILYETIADEQQWAFQTTKWKMLKAGQKLEDLPAPYNKGFNTRGLWSRSRHPNYLGEQGTWCALYIFSIGAGVGIFNWSIIGALLLIVLFLGSSALAEEISSGKYPEYARYCRSVPRFFPGKKYDGSRV